MARKIDSVAGLQAYRDAVRERSSRSFRWFSQRTWRIVQPVPYCSGWHLDAMCDHLEAVTRGQIRNLLINVPPGSGKSTIACVQWPAWEWTLDNSKAFIYTSFDGDLALRDARYTKKLITSDFYSGVWGDSCTVTSDDAAGEFEILAPDKRNKGALAETGGWRYCTSIKGKMTGRHPDRRCVDDPCKPLTAGPSEFSAYVEFHESTLMSRARDKSTVSTVMIMQRLGVGDPSDYFKARMADVVHLNIPLQYDRARAYSTPLGTDPRKEDGEVFWPNKLSAADVAQIVNPPADPAVVSTQWNQNPKPAGGRLFKPAEHFAKRYDVLPADFDELLLSVDAAFAGEASSDPVSLQVWGKLNADAYLILDSTQPRTFTETITDIVAILAKYPKVTAKLIERKANGDAILDTLRKSVSGLIAVNPKDSKEVRARAIIPFCLAGNVLLPSSAPWLFDFVEEIKDFPKAPHDDRVDAMTQAVLYLLARELLETLDYESAADYWAEAFGVDR